jgi:hypothetical protein
MTFIGFLHHFKCDDCQENVYVRTFPKGWCLTTPKMGAIMHHCNECRKKLPIGTRVFEENDREGHTIK